MIEAVYRVRCSGPCQRYLTPDGPKHGDYPDRGEYETREAAETAAQEARWINCDQHKHHAALPNVDVGCLTPICPDCWKPVDGPIKYTDHREWNVGDGPDGPVERLLPYHYMTSWLQKHTTPHSDLVVKWCQEHPEYVLDRDPRGRHVQSGMVPVRLDDGDFATVVDKTHIGHDGRRKTTVQILRLPLRALTIREAKAIADRLHQIISLATRED